DGRLHGELYGDHDDRHPHDRDVDDGSEPARELHAPGHDTKRHVGDPNVRRDRQQDLQRDRHRQLHAADPRPAGQLLAGERDQPAHRDGHGRDHYQHDVLTDVHEYHYDRHSHDRDVDDGPEPAHELHAPGHDTKRHVGDPNVPRDRQPDLQRDRHRQLHAADPRPAGQLHAGEREQPAHRDGHGRDHHQHDLHGELHGHSDDRHSHVPDPDDGLEPPPDR